MENECIQKCKKMGRPIIDLTGKQFNRLLVLHQVKNIYRGIGWLCKCQCGTTKVVSGTNLSSGNTKSCGCLVKERARIMGIKHGHSSYPRSITYKSWGDMIQRCRNSKQKAFSYYGGRGIKICEGWLGKHGFQDFLTDMGECPPGLTLDRINNDGNYEPGNCRWADRKTQQHNRRISKPHIWGETTI